jgi:hypothetical protein
MAIKYVEIVAGTSDARYPIDRTSQLAAGIYVDSNDGYNLKYNQNGTVVIAVNDGGSGSVRLPQINPKAYAMGNAAAAISMFKVATVALTGDAGGVLWYSYHATDGVEVHELTGMVTYAAVDKAGTVTGTITEVAGNQAKAVSAGTITIAWTAVTAADLVTFKAATTDSLTTTTATLVFSIIPLRGTVVLL